MITINTKEELVDILNKYKAYATDYDGTIIDSMHMWNKFASSYVRSKGIEPKNDLDNKIKYLSNLDAAKIIHDDYNMKESVEYIYDDINNFVWDVYPTIDFKKGSSEFLNILSKSNRNYLSSATPKILLELSLDALKINDKYNGIYSSSDLGKSKESGELFLHIIKNEKIGKEDLLVIEDSILAMKKCYELGIDTLIVLDYSNKYNISDIEKYATYFVDLSKLVW